MPHHVVVDGSNLATEGRPMPSLKQLNEAVLAFIAEHPDALITVVVDATFGHRIDPSEVKEFDEAVANNELVAPPAGAVGRGDAFVLSIANKVRATILSNDSFQEFHGQYPWLFDEGRLIGGKPVPHIGWVFVPRVPVRGPVSRSAVKQAKRKSSGQPAEAPSKRRVSPEASQPMPVPKAPPPNATIGKPAAATAEQQSGKQDGRSGGRQGGRSTVGPAAPAPAAAPAPKAAAVNELLPFLDFVQHHPVGTSVNAVVSSYSSHGAYVQIGDVQAYVPLRLMADPAPRSAREVMKIGDAVTLVVASFAPARRSIELAVVGMVPAAEPPAPAPAKRTRAKKAAPEAVVVEPAAPAVEPAAPAGPAEVAPAKKASATKTPSKRSSARKSAAGEVAPAPEAASGTPTPTAAATKAPAKKAPAKKAPAKKAAASATAGPPDTEPPATEPPATKARARKAAAKPAADDAPSSDAAATEAPAAPAVKRTRAKKAAAAATGPTDGAASPATEATRTTPGGRSRRTR